MMCSFVARVTTVLNAQVVPAADHRPSGSAVWTPGGARRNGPCRCAIFDSVLPGLDAAGRAIRDSSARGPVDLDRVVYCGRVRIALIGDYQSSAVAHQAIPLALAIEAEGQPDPLSWAWVPTPDLGLDPAPVLAGFDGVWCVPATPYANTAGVLAAIRYAREEGRPFLGTCGGFQHAMLEYAEAVWGIVAPAHAELDPSAPAPVIAPLACSLVEVTGSIRLVPGSRLATIFGASDATEGYHCRYGLAPEYAALLEDGPLRVGACDAHGDVRAVELDGHPFFFATLFQPERAALTSRAHPLIAAFVEAAALASLRRPADSADTATN
jgi:CTP synthase (UTP-ammonia lyase)